MILALAAAVACSKPQPQPFSVIPMPNDVTLGEGVFNVKGAALQVDEAIEGPSRDIVDAFVKQLETVTGKALPAGEGGFRFLLNPNLAAEQYAINVNDGGVSVEASALNGFVYACETLKQMLPAEIYGSVKAKASWVLPYVSILDQPRFDYRGMHLDPSRHFWSIDEVKRYLDVMAAYKLNRFHWHLTDDQGWRMEVKKYPMLTEVSAWRDGTCIGKDFDSSDGVRYGGYYTQDEMREVVAYAAAKGITVIPEIDLPGHMVAVLAAYPELGCTGGPYEVWQRWGVSEDVLCAGNEDVYTFLEDVLTELIDIFPSEYIHIGGDECPKDRWAACPKCQAKIKDLKLKDHGKITKEQELQCYVTARIQKFLNDRGRKIIGWDEILEGNLAEGATVMSWRGVEGGIEAANRGFDAIMTPSSFVYFDYYQSVERDKEPFGIGGNLPVEKVYGYEPFDGIDPDVQDHILGVQANLWTEYIATTEHLEYMLLPRMCALSEIQWCDAERKDFDRFNASLDHTFRMLDVMGYTYCLDIRGKVGLDRVPARTEDELKQYMETKEWQW